MSLRLYMDEHVHASVTDGLLRRGIDVLTVQGDGHSEQKDEVVLARSSELNRILYTQDEDFLVIASNWQKLGKVFPGWSMVISSISVSDWPSRRWS